MKNIFKIIILVVFSLSTTIKLNAQAGTLDPSFNNNGIKYIMSPNQSYYQSGFAYDVAIQADNKSIIIGYNGSNSFAAYRLNTNGSVDNTFGINGEFQLNLSGNYSSPQAKAVSIQADGKIVIVGLVNNYDYNNYYYGTSYQNIIVRLNPNGTLDNTFGNGTAYVVYNGSNNNYQDYYYYYNYSEANDVVIQTDGKIIASGFAYNYNYYNYNYNFTAFRVNADGTLDQSFGTNGLVTINPPTINNNYYYNYSISYSCAVDNNGKIYLGGRSYDGYTGEDGCIIVRLNNNGSVDNSFNGNGFKRLTFNSNYYNYGEIHSIKFTSDNKIVAGGFSYDENLSNGSYYSYAVAKLNTDGSYDLSFNGTGKVTINTINNTNSLNTNYYYYAYNYGYDLVVLNNNKIVIGGTAYSYSYDYNYYYSNSTQKMSFVRFNANGTVDNTFGNNGISIFQVSDGYNPYDWFYGMAKQSDGKIVAVGYAYSTLNNNYSNQMVAIRIFSNSDCPSDITVQTPSNSCNIAVNNIASNFELYSGESISSITYTITGATVSSGNTDASGTVFNIGNSTVNYTAIILKADETTETRTCSFIVKVEDKTPPTITCPSTVNTSVDINSNFATNVQLGIPTVADLCGAVTYSNNAPSQFQSGQTTVTWTATDAFGNTATCSQIVNVVADNQPPAITCPDNIQTNTSTDLCGANINITAATATDNFGISSVIGTRNDGLALTDVYPLGTTTISWLATDINGLTSTCTQTISVTDVESPKLVGVPANEVVECNSVPNAATVTAIDNCTTSAPSFTETRINGSNSNNYTLIRTWSTTDASGNTTSVSQTITVQDKQSPTVICKPVTVTLTNGIATIAASDINNNSVDNCSAVALSISKSSFDCTNIGANSVTLTVTDASGNSSSCEATVTVVGEIPTCSITSVPTSSVFTGGVSTNLYLGYGAQSTNLQVNAPASGAPYTYSWSGTGLNSYSAASPVFTPSNAGIYNFTVTTTNKYGCTTTCSISICVMDVRVPGTNGNKVYVCHMPPGNSNNPQTLSISVNAVPSHIGLHGGDRLGSCTNQPCTPAARANYTSIDKHDHDSKMEVFVAPNPTTTQFELSIKSQKTEPVNIKVMDAKGRLIESRSKIQANSYIVLGNNFANGIYFAEIVQGKERVVIKLIKGK